LQRGEDLGAVGDAQAGAGVPAGAGGIGAVVAAGDVAEGAGLIGRAMGLLRPDCLPRAGSIAERSRVVHYHPAIVGGDVVE